MIINILTRDREKNVKKAAAGILKSVLTIDEIYFPYFNLSNCLSDSPCFPVELFNLCPLILADFHLISHKKGAVS